MGTDLAILQHPGLLLAIALVAYAILALRLRLPLPLTLVAIAVLIAPLAGFGVPLRHLVEGGFGYLNLILALFAGAFFGLVMRESGVADAVAARIVATCARRPIPVLAIAGAMLFAIGMFVGLAGVAVLATGVFAVPMLRRVGIDDARIGAFIAVLATCGMVAPPLNAPAMAIADGVNMPFLKFERALLFLSLPPAVFTVWWFARGARPPGSGHAGWDAAAMRSGFVCLALVLGFWIALRLFPRVLPDPSAPLVLVAGTIPALRRLGARGWREVAAATFTGTPLMLAAALVAVGVAVQIMTLTGIRGFVVINAMSAVPPWLFAGLAAIPLLGGVLTSVGGANMLGVPFAFALIHQDMILNVSALSAIAALAEFCPPTSIAAALAAYVVGADRLWPIIRASVAPMALMLALALAMLAFARPLARLLVG